MSRRSVRRDWRRDERGVAAPLVALCLMVLIAAAAVSVDLGRVFLASRRLQGLADLAAMSGAQAMGGGSDDASSIAAAGTAAAATIADNAWSPGPVTTRVDPGVYSPDPTQPAAQRFAASSVAPNAARVTLSAPVTLTFASLITGRASLQVTRVATASEAQLAAFSVGSGLASVNGGVANALLSALTGSQVSLSVMDDQALVSAQVDLMSYMGALATRMNLTGASYDTLLNGQVAAPVALSVLSNVLAQEGQGAASAATAKLASAATTTGPVQLASLFDLGPYGAQDHAASSSGATVSLQALGLADALLAAANGQRQLALDLGAAAPGLLDVKAWLAIGQRPSHSPWLTITQSRNVIVSTAQMRLYLSASVAPGAAAAFGAGVLTLPAYAELAAAQARLSALQCPADPTTQSVTLSAQPSLGTLAVSQVDPTALSDFTTPVTLTPATIVNLSVLKATLSAKVVLSSGWQPVVFNQADIQAHTVKSVYADNIAQSTVASLIANTALQVQTPLGGLGVSLAGPAGQALETVLQPAGAALDGVLAQVEQLSGAHLGEADVSIDGLRCRGAALVG